MVTKIILSISLLSLVLLANSQVEEQRKYQAGKYNELKTYLEANSTSEDLTIYQHSSNMYYDIYLDTPDFLLLNRGFSLRFRKRVPSDTTKEITYSFQLKAEMDSLNAARMEVEEAELFFYKIRNQNTWVSLESTLDIIFKQFEIEVAQSDPEAFNEAMNLINLWIKTKAGGPIAPFQKLIHLEVLSTDQIQQLRPVVGLRSERLRSHHYCNTSQNEALNLQPNRIKKDKMPPFFLEHPKSNWILESSLDNTVAFSLFESRLLTVGISEFEIENKYKLSDAGTKLMDDLDESWTSQFDLIPIMDSKYKQITTQFLNSK